MAADRVPAGADPLDPEFGVSLTPAEFEERFLTLHRQLFASDTQGFDEVTVHAYAPPAGSYQVDHCFFHDGSNLHLYYVTGDMRNTEAWIAAYRAGDYERANRVCLEPGCGHAVGPDLFSLRYRDTLLFEPEGRFDLASRSNAQVFSFDRDGPRRYGLLYGVRGGGADGTPFVGFNLTWSPDLETWTAGGGNPVWGPPPWCKPGSTCKDAHVTRFDGRYLLYYIAMDRQGYACVALASTRDWQTIADHGVVLALPPSLRGTMGIESPFVLHRDGLWHLFYTYGEGLHHAVSPSPTGFVAARGNTWDVGTGAYLMGPYHATEIVEQDGRTYLTTDRKEHTRKLNRAAGVLRYRGSYADEKTLEEGIYVAEIEWRGDQPVLRKPHRPRASAP